MEKKKLNKNFLRFILIIIIIAVYSRLFFAVFFKEKSGLYADCHGKKTELDEFYEEEITGLKFLKIESGDFFMGSSCEEEGRKSDESPLTKICVDEFMISETEVRVKDFRLFVSETDYVTTAEKEGFSYVYSPLTGKWEKKIGATWKKPGFNQTDDHPVVHVSFFDASVFAKWLDKKIKSKRVMLPAEYQWEYAAKKGLLNMKSMDEICSYANCADLSAKEIFPGWKISECRDDYIYTSPVKSFDQDQNGLYDMTGNVWEWCNSEYKPYISRKNSRIYGKKKNVVIKGGSFYSKPEFLRPSAREHLSSGEKRAYDIGFRLVITGED